MPLYKSLLMLAAVVLPFLSGAAECPVFPIPKEYRVNDADAVALSDRTAIVLGAKAGEPEKYAASRLTYILKKRFGIDAPTVTEEAVPVEAGTLLVLGTLDSNTLLKSLKDKHAVNLGSLQGKDQMQDAFALENIEDGDKQVVLMIGAAPRSVIYAQYVFLETLTREGGKVLCPDGLSVRDWSGLRYRDWWPGNPAYITETPDALDQVTHARANMTQFRTFNSAEVSEDLVNECWKRGLKPYGVINGAVARDGHAYAEQETRSWLEKGCYGIYVSFDDFGMGEDPEALCGKVTGIIKEHCGEVGDRIAVIAGADYDYLNSYNNKRMAKFKDFEEAIFYITGPPHDVFSTKRHYDDARAVGIKNYIWWHNFAMGATCFYAPVPVRRYFAQMPFNQKCWGRFTFDDLREGDKHMTGYCAQNDGFDIAAIQLFWAWDPVHYDYEKARGATYRQRHGDAAVEAMRKLDDNMYGLTEYYRIMWRHSAMTEWLLKDVSKREDVLALIDRMQEQFRIARAGRNISYMSEKGYDEYFARPLEAHLDAAGRLASLDFPDYAVQKREGFGDKGGPDLLETYAAFSLREKMVNLLLAGRMNEAEAYLTDLRKEALPMLDILEKELSDMWYTEEYVQGWRGMLTLEHWESYASDAFTGQVRLNIRRDADGLVVMESSGGGDCEILFTVDGPAPAVGAAEVYDGPLSIPGSHVVRAVVRRKDCGLTTHVFEHCLGRSKKGWKVVYTDSDDGKDATGANLIDGNLDTFWFSDRTNTKPPHPHEIQIDMGRENPIQAILLYPRANNGRGVPKKYEVYVSADGKAWGEALTAGEFGRIESPMIVALGSTVSTRFLRLVFLSDFRSIHFSAVAEVDVLDLPQRAAVDPEGALRSGLRYRYYETGALPRWRPPRENEVRASGVIASPTLDLDGRREDNFAALYEGYLKVPEDGLYVFSVLSGDGSVLWIDGEPIVDNDGRHGHIERSGSVGLAEGYHTFRLAYFQWLKSKILNVSWQPPGEKKQPLPAEVLFHEKDMAQRNPN